jgi:hypothetical protein
MSEVAARASASRGRGSGRGGRGGFAGRGGRRPNGDKPEHKAGETPAAFEDDGDVGGLRKQYGDKTSIIREMFPDWSEVDVLFALQETNGDQEEAVTRIAEGTISQWGEVSKAKKTPKPKAKEAPAASNETSSATNTRASRGARAVSEGGRGGRGRATERGGRGGGRGRSTQPATNGTRQKENQQLSVPTEESPAWGTETVKADVVEEREPLAEKSIQADAAPAATPQAKTWASMLRQSTAPKVAPKPKETLAPEPVESDEPVPAIEAAESEPVPTQEPEEESTPVVEPASIAPVAIVEPEVALSPSHDELTKTNLEQNPASATATPLSAAQQQHQAQRATSGYAASAIKAAAERTVRTPTYQRRVLDQEEAVRMPGNREVDRAAVQFGAFSLGDGDEDIDGDREEPETRTQPPADSPVSHPRASLPPVAQPTAVHEQKAASGLPSATAPQASGAHGAIPSQANTQPQAPQTQQYGRFGQPGAQDVPGATQKPLDPFNQQSTPSAQPPFDNLPSQGSQAQSQQPGGPFSSAPSDYSSYYTANDRNPYNYYGQHFGQQQGAQGQDTVPGQQQQQRPFGSYNASQQSDNLSQYPQSGAGVHAQPRFGAGSNDNQNSGHSTPNPTTQAQQQAQQAQQQPGAPGSQPQSHGQGYPGGYNHPYYNNPYYHQYYSGYAQGGFGPYGSKGGMYGQPYGVSPSAPFDHANSPVSFAQSSLHRDSGVGSGVGGDYGRAGPTQGGGAPGLGGSSFGSVHDSFARGSSSFQSQGFNNQGQPGNASSNDDLKPYGDSKSGAGPSPSLGGARPGSATTANNASTSQSGLPTPQTTQMGAGGYAGYPSHLQGHSLHGGSAYGIGGAGGANQHGSTPYGSYGQGGGFGSAGYYGGAQQQQQQQQQRGGGWGGNYH